MKTVFRFFSFLLLVAAVVVGALDSIRSVSTSAVSIVTLGEAWSQLLPTSLSMTEATVVLYAHPQAWRWVEVFLAVVPAFAALLALSLLFWMIGYRKPRSKAGIRFAT